MVGVANSTPLLALDAAALDMETTGLDAEAARVVQLAAIRVRDGAIRPKETFETLVDPEMPVPESSTAIHGIAPSDLRDAPRFDAVALDLERFLGGAVVIGHNIGFDLTVLRNEYRRVGMKWYRPRSLCTMMLARLVGRSLPDFSLDAVAAWLGVAIEGRHTAPGDARAAADIFLRLIPLLRAAGIRTLAEAEAATRAQADTVARQIEAGWVAPVRARGNDQDAALRAIDSYPFRHRARDVMSAPPLWAEPGMACDAAARALAEKGVSAFFVRDAAGDGGEAGIVTERDLLRALANPEIRDRTVGGIASRPLVCVAEDDFVYRAIGTMRRHGIRHLGVTGSDGGIVGALTSTDVMRERADEALILGDELGHAESVPALGAIWARQPIVARSLLEEGVPARDIAAVLSTELRMLTARAAGLAEARMRDEGRGGPPVPYCVLVLGSGGRGESLLAPDQDNAVVFASGTPGSEEDRWFEALGTHMSDILHEVGVPYCRGGVMASKADWRHDLAGWRETVDGWLKRGDWKDVCYVDIFYDLHAVHGDRDLARAVAEHAYGRARQAPGFLKLLAAAATDFTAPLGLFGGIRTRDGRVDLKRGGLLALVSGARVLALRHGVTERSTRRRLEAVMALGEGNADDLADVVEAHEILLGEILAQQLRDMEDGIPPSGSVAVKGLGRHETARLKWALRQVDVMNTLVGDPMAFG
ncbi:CBS domain-containing protein [Kaustia mangrovi]|uniref:CBS domain-containing protein n=1 Tax=Kaustia mangrovi TaxID=2593653 RepID=A0A7S8HBZ5_9HYPH|nr:DUF294 nucleotidyltransferase-like domain-containing protein [Kaustia mangrovi]QPC43066.1 CBS domain-containing protein [Kaustia mangrovi]